MTGRLKALLKKSKKTAMTDKEQEEQRRSFAYGNSKIENDEITWGMIDHEAEKLAFENEQ